MQASETHLNLGCQASGELGWNKMERKHEAKKKKKEEENRRKRVEVEILNM